MNAIVQELFSWDIRWPGEKSEQMILMLGIFLLTSMFFERCTQSFKLVGILSELCWCSSNTFCLEIFHYCSYKWLINHTNWASLAMWLNNIGYQVSNNYWALPTTNFDLMNINCQFSDIFEPRAHWVSHTSSDSLYKWLIFYNLSMKGRNNQNII